MSAGRPPPRRPGPRAVLLGARTVLRPRPAGQPHGLGALVAARRADHPSTSCCTAHLYGFASVDSDLDLRASHLLPTADLIGLRSGAETLQSGGVRDGVELDVVSHDLRCAPAHIRRAPGGSKRTAGCSAAACLRTGSDRRQARRGARTAAHRVAALLAAEVPRLCAELAAARDASPLPEVADPAAVEALHDLVVRTRLEQDR
jgi:hypothetical protein